MNDDFEIVGDAAREARVVAVVLGEASDFEREEVERLCEENPELAVFRRRMEAVHGLIEESRVQNPESRTGEWRLAKERRESVLAKLGEEETVVKLPGEKRRFASSNAWRVASGTACAAVMISAVLLVSIATVGKSGRTLSSKQMAVLAEQDKSASARPSVERLNASLEALKSERTIIEEAVLLPSIAMEEERRSPMEAQVQTRANARKPSSPGSAMAKVIASNTASPSSIPVPKVDMPVESADFGDGDDYGAGWGNKEKAVAALPERDEESSRGLRSGSFEIASKESLEGLSETGMLLKSAGEKSALAANGRGDSSILRKEDFGFGKSVSSGAFGRRESRGEVFGEVAGSDEDSDADPFASNDSGLGGGGLAMRGRSESGYQKTLAGTRVEGLSDGRALLEKRFKVPNTLRYDVGGEPGGDADPFASEEPEGRPLAASQPMQQFLEDSGVAFPEGASAEYDPVAGELIVRNTASNIDLTSKITGDLSLGAPKSLRDTTKFVEVSQDNTEELGFDWLVGDSKVSDGTGRPLKRDSVVAAKQASESKDDYTGLLPPLDSGLVNGGVTASGGASPSLLAQERIRREAASQQAVDMLMEGRKAYAAKDYEEANRLYKESLNTLPSGPKTEVKRNENTAHLADGSVALAQQYRRIGKYDEAKALFHDVLEVDPDRFEAQKSLEYFDEPIRSNTSVTSEHSENVDEVRRLLYKGEGHYNLADYDQSEETFKKVLKLDPHNKAARRWLERNASIKSDYYRAAYDQTRSQLLMEVDKAWELTVPVPKGGSKDDLGLMAELMDEENGRFPVTPSTPADVKVVREFVYPTEYDAPLGFDEGLLPPPDGKPASTGNRGSATREVTIVNKLQNIIIPRIDFENTPIDEALEYLTQKTMELDSDPDPNRKGVNFVIEQGFHSTGGVSMDDDLGGGLLLGSSPSEKKIDILQLENVPLSTALEYIASKTGLRYRVDEYAVTLLSIGSEASADLLTRTWKISPEEYKLLMAEAEEAEFHEDDPFVDENSVVEEPEWSSSEKEALSNSGVDFPDGSSVRYSEESGVLIVRNTVSNLDLVDQISVNLKKRVEVAQETLAMDEKDAATQGDSTFSLHVSDVSFKLAKAALEQGKWPETVRVEEFVNAFSYGERALGPNERVGVAMEQAAHPFLSQRNLLRVSLQTAATGRGAGVPLRLTVVLDKSGSMERLDRATAVDEAFRVLVEQLNPGDKVTLVGFSRTPTLLADHIDGAEGARLLEIFRGTPSEGGTNVEEALKLARAKAEEHFEEGAQNRVILLTDGIANLGESVPENLMTLVEGMRENGVAFDACGVGVEGLNDDILEALTRKGDGRYYLLGSTAESGADFAKQVAGALRPAAQNVKVQIEWNTDRVGKWRLYGYEKHELKKEDFRNDSVDAAEMAAEEEGVALYHVEVKPDGEGPLGVARVRFLDVANDEMVEREWVIVHEGEASALKEADGKMRLAGVAGLVAEKLARSAVGERAEWDDLLEMTRQLKTVFPREKRVKDLERMIEQAKGLE